MLKISKLSLLSTSIPHRSQKKPATGTKRPMLSPDRQIDPRLAPMPASPLQNNNSDVEMSNMQSPPGTPKTTNMAFPPTETIAIDSGTNKQHQVRTTETVVKASQGFHSNVLTREVQEDSMTVAPSQHIAITITPARTNSPSMGILTNKYIAIKINRTDNTANDESIMAIIQSIFKAILKAAPAAQIIAPETNKLLDPITRKQGNIPDSIETRVIRRYVHKDSLTKDYLT